VLECLSTGFGLVIGFIDRLRIVPASNYNSFTELHTPNIAVTTAHKVFPVFASRFLVTASNNGESSAFMLSAPAKSSRHRLPYNSHSASTV
jgi:hypothetical protein